MTDKEDYSMELTKLFVILANQSQVEIQRNGIAAVEKIMKGNRVVVGVWQDASEPSGVGILVVKGEPHLRKVITNGKAEKVGLGAVSCVNLEQAMALGRMLGDLSAR